MWNLYSRAGLSCFTGVGKFFRRDGGRLSGNNNGLKFKLGCQDSRIPVKRFADRHSEVTHVVRTFGKLHGTAVTEDDINLADSVCHEALVDVTYPIYGFLLCKGAFLADMTGKTFCRYDEEVAVLLEGVVG